MSPDPFVGHLVKNIILGGSAFAVGVLLYRALFYERYRRRPWLAIGFGGVIIVLALIGEAVANAPLIDFTWRAGLYVVGLAAITVGFLTDAFKARGRGQRRRAQWEDEQRGP